MKNEKQQQAYNLYFQTGLSQAEIARLLDIDRKTIHNWMAEGKWNFAYAVHHSVELGGGELLSEGDSFSTGPAEISFQAGAVEEDHSRLRRVDRARGNCLRRGGGH